MKKTKYLKSIIIQVWVPEEEEDALELIENDLSFTNEVWKKVKDIEYSEGVTLVRDTTKTQS